MTATVLCPLVKADILKPLRVDTESILENCITFHYKIINTKLIKPKYLFHFESPHMENNNVAAANFPTEWDDFA